MVPERHLFRGEAHGHQCTLPNLCYIVFARKSVLQTLEHTYLCSGAGRPSGATRLGQSCQAGCSRAVTASIDVESTVSTMSSCHRTQHTANCPVLVRLRLPQRLRFKAVHGHKQQLRKKPSILVSAHSSGRSSHTCRLIREARRPQVACSAAAAPAEVKPAEQQGENIPRGDTAGANLILENVTVQAGHRDLLEVICATYF